MPHLDGGCNGAANQEDAEEAKDAEAAETLSAEGAASYPLRLYVLCFLCVLVSEADCSS